MKIIWNKIERDWVDKDRVYEIRVGSHSCTLYCEGINIGSYMSVDSAKRAARNNEARGRYRILSPWKR